MFTNDLLDYHTVRSVRFLARPLIDVHVQEWIEQVPVVTQAAEQYVGGGVIVHYGVVQVVAANSLDSGPVTFAGTPRGQNRRKGF